MAYNDNRDILTWKRLIDNLQHKTDEGVNAYNEAQISVEEPVTEAVGEFAQPIYDLIDELGGSEDAHEIVLNDMVRYLGSDQIEDGEFGSMNTENLVDLIEQRNRQNKTYRSSEFKSVDAETQSLRDELTKQMLENSAALAKLISELNK
jgi:hypothetical protein